MFHFFKYHTLSNLNTCNTRLGYLNVYCVSVEPFMIIGHTSCSPLWTRFGYYYLRSEHVGFLVRLESCGSSPLKQRLVSCTQSRLEPLTSSHWLSYLYVRNGCFFFNLTCNQLNAFKTVYTRLARHVKRLLEMSSEEPYLNSINCHMKSLTCLPRFKKVFAYNNDILTPSTNLGSFWLKGTLSLASKRFLCCP